MSVKKTSARQPKTMARRKRTKQPAAKATTSAASYRFDSMLTISTLGALRTRLSQLAENDTDIQLDASAIEIIDAAAIQLMLAFCIELKSRNKAITWLTPSQKLIASVSLLGLTQKLGIA